MILFYIASDPNVNVLNLLKPFHHQQFFYSLRTP